MAAAQEGKNAGRAGTGARQGGRPARSGRAEPGIDPTNWEGQTPSQIFGLDTGLTSSGAPGTKGGSAPADVTVEAGQLSDTLGGSSDAFVQHSGAPGSQGAASGPGGDSVTYTDPWGVIGGVNREVTTSGHIDGVGDWTQANDDGYAAGPTLPGLTNARPTSSGAGQGRVRGPNHPNARS